VLDVAVFGAGLHVNVADLAAGAEQIRRSAGTAAHSDQEAGADPAHHGRRFCGPDRSRGTKKPMSLRRTRAMFEKEFRHILRDSRSLIMALFLPLFQMLLFGYALNLDVDRIPTLIYDGDHSADSRALIERFRASRFFEIEGFTNSYGEIEKGIDKSKVLLGIVIPRDYSQRLNGGGKANVQILLDGSDSNTASIALSYVEGLVQNYALQVRSNGQDRSAGMPLVSPVDSRVRIWYNSTLESTNYIVPGLIAAMMMVIAALLTSLTVAREWEMGTMEQLLSTPVRAGEIVLGKMLAFFVVGVADTTIAVLVGIFVYGVPFRGSVWFLALSTMIFLTGAFFWGILVSAIARTQLFAFQLGLVTTFLPSFLLSGFLYAIENMPVPIQIITHVVPARYFVTIVRGIFLKGIGMRSLVGTGAFSGGLLDPGVLGGGTQNEAEARLRGSHCYERTHFRHHSQRAEPVVPQPAHAHVSLRAADVSAHHLRLRGQPGRGQPAHGVDGHGPIAAEPRFAGVFQGSGRFLLTACRKAKKTFRTCWTAATRRWSCA
jgi:ABC-2 type transport system permease protein